MPVPLSVLDQSPIVFGASPRDAVAATIALAKRAEELGYHRYWLAEHHALPSLADAAPEVLLGRLTGETATIRLGSGGIMLPHYSSFKVAETFRMLEALAPGRIDLGVGRAPGGTRLVSAALRSGDPERFPEQVQETLTYLAGPPEDPRLRDLIAQPAGPSSPALWILGSSNFGAQLAAQFGLPYAFAQFIGGDYPAVTQGYRRAFQPSDQLAAPHVLVTVAAIVGETDAEADALALPALLSRLRRLRGISASLPSLEEARAYPWTDRERAEVAASRNMIVGSPATVRTRLESLVRAYEADELMVVTIAPDYASRMRSYELLAGAWREGGSAAEGLFGNAVARATG
jgi:luciferase family oxidoreductase group 1